VVVVIQGSGFAEEENEVSIGGIVYKDVPSFENGTVIIFETPKVFLDNEIDLAIRRGDRIAFAVSVRASLPGASSSVSSGTFYVSSGSVYSNGFDSGIVVYNNPSPSAETDNGDTSSSGDSKNDAPSKNWWEYFIAGSDNATIGAFPGTPGGVGGPILPFTPTQSGCISDWKGECIAGTEDFAPQGSIPIGWGIPVECGISDGQGGVISGTEWMGWSSDCEDVSVTDPNIFGPVGTAIGIGAIGGAGSGGDSNSIGGGIGVGGVGLTIPFGGKVNEVTYCTCLANPGIVLDVGEPNSAKVFVSPLLTRIYSQYDIYSTGQWVLGNYSKGGTCLKQAYPTCTSTGVTPDGTATMIGTSLVGGGAGI